MSTSIHTKEHEDIVKKIKKARMEMGLGQKQVAKLLEKTQSYISKIEAGQRRLDIVQLKKFAKIYNKKIDYFF